MSGPVFDLNGLSQQVKVFTFPSCGTDQHATTCCKEPSKVIFALCISIQPYKSWPTQVKHTELGTIETARHGPSSSIT